MGPNFQAFRGLPLLRQEDSDDNMNNAFNEMNNAFNEIANEVLSSDDELSSSSSSSPLIQPPTSEQSSSSDSDESDINYDSDYDNDSELDFNPYAGGISSDDSSQPVSSQSGYTTENSSEAQNIRFFLPLPNPPPANPPPRNPSPQNPPPQNPPPQNPAPQNPAIENPQIENPPAVERSPKNASSTDDSEASGVRSLQRLRENDSLPSAEPTAGPSRDPSAGPSAAGQKPVDADNVGDNGDAVEDHANNQNEPGEVFHDENAQFAHIYQDNSHSLAPTNVRPVGEAVIFTKRTNNKRRSGNHDGPAAKQGRYEKEDDDSSENLKHNRLSSVEKSLQNYINFNRKKPINLINGEVVKFWNKYNYKQKWNKKFSKLKENKQRLLDILFDTENFFSVKQDAILNVVQLVTRNTETNTNGNNNNSNINSNNNNNNNVESVEPIVNNDSSASLSQGNNNNNNINVESVPSSSSSQQEQNCNQETDRTIFSGQSFTRIFVSPNSNVIKKTQGLPKFQQAFGKPYQTDTPTTTIIPTTATITKTGSTQRTYAVPILLAGNRILATSSPNSLRRTSLNLSGNQVTAVSLGSTIGSSARLATTFITESAVQHLKKELSKAKCVKNEELNKVVEAKQSQETSESSQRDNLLAEQLLEFEAVLERVTNTSNMKERISSLESSSSNNSTFIPTTTTTKTITNNPVRLTYLTPSMNSTSVPLVVVSSSIATSTTTPTVSVPTKTITASKTLKPSTSTCTKPKTIKTNCTTSVTATATTNTTTSAATTTTTCTKTTPITKPQQKPQEDEQTTKRIYAILGEYAEQLRNSPDLNNKPAPRRRSNPPTNPSQCSKRKKCSSKINGSELSPGGDDMRGTGSDDSSNGGALDTNDEPSSEKTESNSSETSSVSTVPTTTANTVVTSKPLVVGSTLPCVLPGNVRQVLLGHVQRQPLVVTKGSKLIRVVSANAAPTMLTALPVKTIPGTPALVLQQLYNINKLSGAQVNTVRQVKLPISSISSAANLTGQPPVILPHNTFSNLSQALGLVTTKPKIEESSSTKTDTSSKNTNENQKHEFFVNNCRESATNVEPTPCSSKTVDHHHPRKNDDDDDDKPKGGVGDIQIRFVLKEEEKIPPHPHLYDCSDLGVDKPSRADLFPDFSIHDLDHEDSDAGDQLRRFKKIKNEIKTDPSCSSDSASEETFQSNKMYSKKVVENNNIEQQRPFASLNHKKVAKESDEEGNDCQCPRRSSRHKSKKNCPCCNEKNNKDTKR